VNAVTVAGRITVWRLLGSVAFVALASVTLPARAEAQLGSLISPGKLSKAHETLEGISNCQKCHEQGRKVVAEKCLSCHAPVASRMAKKIGVHRNVTDCVSCHVEHAGVDGELRPFDQKKFDHAAVTGFALTGKHAPTSMECTACHKTRSFLTLTSTCVSCHADVHKGSLGSNCTSCHSTQVAFKSLGGQFDHSKSAFPLTGAHRTASCTACHINGQFKGVKFSSCTDCHREPHRQTLGVTCTSCHTTQTWATKKIDHGRTSFPLVGRHAAVECAACHRQPAMKAKPKADTCASCHVDVHRGAFKQDCKSCHSEAGFGQTPFDHSQTTFVLNGKHLGVRCEACHKNVVLGAATPAAKRVADFRGLKTSCVSCHADVHQGSLGAACETCHTSTTFHLTNYKHPRFPEFFSGQHATVPCDQCHLPDAPTRPIRTATPVVMKVAFKDLPTTCSSCHQDVHLGQVGLECQRCHNVQAPKFALAGFSHATTAFALTGRHDAIECALCHKREMGLFPSGTGSAVRLKGVAHECRACHVDVHEGQLDNTCESCHKTTSFKVPQYRHRNPKLSGFFVGRHLTPACEACHKPEKSRAPRVTTAALRFKVGTQCVACHTDVHRGSLGPNCGSCHRP
jgi:hypothetical protein